MNNENLKQSIRDVVKTNGVNAITGQLMQDSLLTIINHFGSGSIYAGFAVPTTNPVNTDVNMFYFAKTPGTYTNFGGYVLTAAKVVVFSNKTGVWVATEFFSVKSIQSITKTGTVGNVDTYTILYTDGTTTVFTVTNGDHVTIVDGFDSSDVNSASSAKNAKTLMDIIKIGGVKDWVLGPYNTGDVVRNLGLIWIAVAPITSAVPGNNANWQLYFPSVKPPSIFVSDATTFTVNLVNNTCVFTGASTNKVITGFGSYNIPAQTVDCSANPTYYTLIFNISTNVVRAVAVYDSGLRPLGVNDYIVCYVMNLNSTLRDVFNAKKYRLIDSTGTVDYPIKPVATADVIYNRFFSTYQASRTDAEKFWLNKAIMNIEFYNVKDNTTVVLYGLGKNYGGTNLTYLGFIYTETGKPSVQLFADEFNNAFSMTYDANLHSGVKTYYLRGGTSRQSNNTIYGKVTIDWGQVPNTQRIVEPNSGVINNSNIVRTSYVKSEIFNNPLGFVKFSKSRSFNDYFTSPTIDSYSGAAGTGIPKSPFEDCREWAKEWDLFVSAPPAGYSVVKETLTTDVPTDTDPSGKLPIYGYTFTPAKLAAGDPTGGNAQTLPRIILNCSIHGFEKTPSFVVYEFMKQIFNNWKSHSFLEYLRFNVEFVIIPFANPHGWNAGGGNGTRKNFNNVDLNRNFPTFWVGGGTSADSTYPGPSALSEIESQSIYTWMQSKITSNTIMAVDFHNFHGIEQSNPKLYNMAWVVNLGSELGQSSANVLIKELSAKYKAKSDKIPQTDDYFIGQSNNYNGPGFSGSAFKSLGSFYASTFEVCQNFRFNSGFKSFDTDAMTFGVETFTNYLRVFLADQLEDYNRVK